MLRHMMISVGSALETECGACGGWWVKNRDVNPYNRMPNWKTYSGEYQTEECTGKKSEHIPDCNCRGCCEK